MWRDAATQSIDNFVRLELEHEGDYEIQIHLLGSDPRRSFTTVLTGVFGFLVRSGVAEDFRVSCHDFLVRTGRTILAEILSRWNRSKRQTHTFLETDFNDGSDVSIVCASRRELSVLQTNKTSQDNEIVPPQRDDEELGQAKIPGGKQVIDDYIRHHRDAYKKEGVTWKYPVLPYRRIVQDAYWAYPTSGFGHSGLTWRDNVNPANRNETNYCMISDLKCQIVVSSYLAQNHTVQGCGESPTMTLGFQILEWELEDQASLELCHSMRYESAYLMSMRLYKPRTCTEQFMNRFRNKKIPFLMKTVANTYRLEPDGVDVQSQFPSTDLWREQDCKYRMFLRTR